LCGTRFACAQTKIEQHFGGFFHQIKVRQPIEREDSLQTVIHLALCLSLLMEAVTGRVVMIWESLCVCLSV
jgi:hypothetical protein